MSEIIKSSVYEKIYEILDFPETDYCGADTAMERGSIHHNYIQEIEFPKELANMTLVFRIQDPKFPRLCCSDWLNSFAYCLFIGSEVEDDFSPIYDINLRFYTTHDFADGTRIILFNAY